MFVPFALGYLLSYLYRVVNAVIAPDLSAEIGLTAADLGLLTSAYFLSFALFQLPLGILLDRFGPRRTEAGLLLFASLGAWMFATADDLLGLTAGRALIGLGVSGCLMAAFKAYVQWFPLGRLPLVNGLQMAAGGVGALTATAPVEAALQLTDWRGLFLALAVSTMLVALLIYTSVPDRESPQLRSGMADQFRGVAQVFGDRFFWSLAPWTVMSQATFLAIQGLWAGPWLRDVAGLDRATTAGHLAWIAAAMIAGFIVMGALTERLSRLGVQPVRVAATGMAVFMVLLGILIMGLIPSVLTVWLLFGFFGTTGILPYAILSQGFPSALAGRAITSLNLLVFLAAFASQWAIGALIDLWPRTAAGSFDPAGYRWAFTMMLGLQVAGMLWYLFSDWRE